MTLTATLLLSSALLLTVGLSGCSEHDLNDLIEADPRTEQEIRRNPFRHPIETLEFFAVEPHMTVVEIWPGGGWYTSILAPYLKENGKLIAAHFDPNSHVTYFRNARAKFEQRAKHHDAFSKMEYTIMAPPEQLDIAASATADRVLTFRNVHNWMRNKSEQAVFNGFFQALKPGGILGVVEHRAPESFDYEAMVISGYVTESYVIELANKAGFELIGRSEINSNPQDTKDHFNGVWTLPPTLRVKDDLREKNASHR